MRAQGIEIVDVQLLGGGGSRVLRIFIDKPEGVTHADCEFISQNVGTILDVEDVIPGRALHARSQFAGRGAEAHQAARVRALRRARRSRSSCAQPVENQRHWVGALKSFAEGIITLEPSPGRSVQFPLDQVEKANLKFEW